MTAIAVKGQVCASKVDDPTRRVLTRMMKERTGTSILDSGGEPRFDGTGRYLGSTQGYGRNFERNAGRDLDAEPEATVSFRRGCIEVTLNVYHWLASRLTFNEAEDEKFSAWCDLPENEDEPWLVLAEKYMEHLAALGDPERGCCSDCGPGGDGACDGSCRCHEHRAPPAGIYGDGEPMTVNTYNGEDLLSQTIQYVFWTEGERGSREAHVLLQVHGGGDVRGGYTRPRFFDVTGDEETCIFDNARATIACDNDECGAHWTTDDGCHWYDDGTCGQGYVQLEQYEKVEASDDVFAEAEAFFTRLVEDEERQGSLFPRSATNVLAKVAATATSRADETEDDTSERTVWTLVEALAADKRLLRYTEAGDGYCPKCKAGRLAAYLW